MRGVGDNDDLKLVFACLDGFLQGEFIGRVESRAEIRAVEPRLCRLPDLAEVKHGIALLGGKARAIAHRAAEAGQTVGGGDIDKGACRKIIGKFRFPLFL